MNYHEVTTIEVETLCGDSWSLATISTRKVSLVVDLRERCREGRHDLFLVVVDGCQIKVKSDVGSMLRRFVAWCK
jgi:hypothetical protein